MTDFLVALLELIESLIKAASAAFWARVNLYGTGEASAHGYGVGRF